LAVFQVTRSDLTGKDGADDEFGRLVVRNYPGVDGPRQLDVLPAEVSGLKTTSDVVEVDYTPPGETNPQRLLVLKDEFDQLAPDMPGLLAKARGLKGRPRST